MVRGRAVDAGSHGGGGCRHSVEESVGGGDYEYGSVSLNLILYALVPAGSPSRGGDVAVYVFDMDQPSLPTHFYSVLESVSVFMALSTAFHSINSPDKSLLSHFVLPVLFLPLWSFQLRISL